jgi:response regulator of citrate/malate metabolism
MVCHDIRTTIACKVEDAMTVYIAFGSRVVGMIIIQILVELAKSFDMLGHSRKLLETVSVISRLRPDLVILEDQLLDGRALELVDFIRVGNWARTIVVISTLTTPPTTGELRAKGIDYWFQLPLEREQLRSLLQQLSRQWTR